MKAKSGAQVAGSGGLLCRTGRWSQKAGRDLEAPCLPLPGARPEPRALILTSLSCWAPAA